jgi:hypothetical protein
MPCLHFTATDLGKITSAPAPNALLETTASVHRVHHQGAGMATSRPGIRRWHREMNGSLARPAPAYFSICFLGGQARRQRHHRRQIGDDPSHGNPPDRRWSSPIWRR